MFGVKVTVAKTEFYPELVKEVNKDIAGQEEFGRCPFLKKGRNL